MVIESFISKIQEFYINLNNLPPYFTSGIRMLIFSIFIVLFAFFILKFYQTLSKRNFIKLDLARYNYSEHHVAKKFSAVMLYFIEYILIMPVLILLWFIALSSILLLLASERDVVELLMLSGAMVLAIRIFAYFNDEMSRELGKLFPLIALSIFLLTPSIFKQVDFLNKLTELPLLLGNAFLFYIMIVISEIILRFTYTIVELIKGKEEVGEEIEE